MSQGHVPLATSRTASDYVQVLPSGAMGQGYFKLSPFMVTKDTWESFNSYSMVKDLGWQNAGSGGGQFVSQLQMFPIFGFVSSYQY